jgi:cullin-associated NEDD8-dissociated protein 1
MNDDLMQEVLTLLLRKQKEKRVDTSVPTMALRAVITNVKATPTVARIVSHLVLPGLYDSPETLSVDFMDVIIDVLKRFGSSLGIPEVKKTLDALIGPVADSKGLVRKRAVTATGLLGRYLSDKQWQSLEQYLVKGLESDDRSDRNAMILLAGTLSRTEPSRFRSSFHVVFPKLLECIPSEIEEFDGEDLNNEIDTSEGVFSSLEAMLGLGATTVAPYVPDMLRVCRRFMDFDPNFIGMGDDDFNMEDEDDDFEFGGSDDDGEFSDDEDQSWKLRRYAARLAGKIGILNSRQLPLVYSHVLALMVSRLSSEREDAVKAAVIVALGELVILAKTDGGYYTYKSAREHVRRNSDVSIATEQDPQVALSELLPTIIKSSLKDLDSKKSIPVANSHAYLTLIGNLVATLDGIEAELGSIVEVLDALSKSKVSLMPEILELVAIILENNDGSSYLCDLASIIRRGIQDSYYKVALDALAVCKILAMRLGSTSGHIPDSLLQDLIEAIIQRADDISLDLETREKAVRALAHLVPNTQVSSFENVVEDVCRVISTLLASETTRIVSMEAIEVLCTSQNLPILSAKWIAGWIDKLLLLLNQNSRHVRLSALRALLALSQYVEKTDVSGKDLERALKSVSKTLLQKYTLDGSASSDPIILNVVTMILTNVVGYVDPNGLMEFVLGVISGQYQAAPLVSTSNVVQIGVSSNEALESLVRKFITVHRAKESVVGPLLDLVVARRESNPDLAAKVVATVITTVPLEEELVNVSRNIGEGKDLKWSILLYGNIGHLTPLTSDLGPLYSRLQKGDELKLVVTQALGQIIARNPEPYLDSLLQKISASSGPDGFLYIAAIRGVINDAGDGISPYAERIWDVLFQVDAESEESEQAVIAECVGRLSISNPETFLPQLRSYISSPRPSVRATVVAAVKYTFGQSDARYDGLLRPIVVDFLALMDDNDLHIRQVALTALVSALHNKPHLVIPHLGRLLPLLYRETVERQDLIRLVPMGPFKHKVDDGLDLRKSAYETIYTLASTITGEQLHSFGTAEQLVERVLAGLSDDHDIKVLSCLIIGKLASLDISVLTSGGTLDLIITKFSALLAVVVKENAIKQEFEKQSETVRNVHRSSSQIDAAIQSAIATNQSIPLSDVELGNWTKYYTKTLADSKLLPK